MSSRLLPAFIDDLDETLRSTVPFVRRGELPTFRVLDLCTAYRRRGIARFLSTADPIQLFVDLHRSAGALSAHLSTPNAHPLASSQALPWFDALASGDQVAADLIAARASPDQVADEEYEEDFAYMRFLFGVVNRSASVEALDRLVQRQLQLDPRGEAPRARACQALLKGHTATFVEAFEQLIEQRQDDYASGMASEKILEIDWSTEGQVFVEGIALLKVAALRRIEPALTFRFIPDLVLDDSNLLMHPDDWMRPDDLPRQRAVP